MDIAAETARTLNKVKTAANARFVIGRVLKYVHVVYEDLDSLGNQLGSFVPGSTFLDEKFGYSSWKTGIDKKAVRLRIDALRMKLESLYKALPKEDFFMLTAASITPIRDTVSKLIVEGASIEAMTGKSHSVSIVAELGTGIKDLPVVVGKAAKATVEVAKSVVSEAGKIAGSAVGGVFSGLGVWSFVLIGAVALIVFMKVKSA